MKSTTLDRNKIIKIEKPIIIKNREDIILKLQKIFHYYKEEYGLMSLSLEYLNDYYYGCCFQDTYNNIIISEQDIYESFTDQIFLNYLNNPKSIYEVFVKILLHELCHAIQFQWNSNILKQADKEIKLLNQRIDFLSFKELNKQYRLIPAEKESDEFANKEWVKWR